MWLRPVEGVEGLPEQGADMVCPDREAFDKSQEDFRRDSLLLLAEIRDYNRRMCEVMERLLGRQPEDPRYKYTPRLHPSEK